MGNRKTGARIPKGMEVIEAAAHIPGGDPLSVRIVRGSLTFALPGFGGQVAKKPDGANVGDDQPAVAGTVAGLDAVHSDGASAIGWMDRFSDVALYLDFVGGGALAKATIERHRILDNGDVVSDGADIVDVAHHVLVRDNNSGLRTIYRIKDITLDGATAITLKVAGEGLGFKD